MKTTCSFLLAALLAGCNAQPLEYQKTGDMKSGPGMFSGASGGFSASAAKESAPASTPAPQPAAQAAKPAAPAMTDEEYREFQDWREWKRQREAAGKK